MNGRTSILAIVHDVRRPFSKDSGVVCANPLCSVSFKQTGLAIKPRRFCCDECKQAASIIKRAAAFLAPLGKEKAWKILEGR